MNIDIKTIALLFFIVNSVNACLMVIIWHQYRVHYRGLSLLLADLVLQTIGSLCLLLRGVLPDFVSIILSNTLIIIGALLVLMGLERFFNQKRNHIYNYFLIVVFIFAISYFTFIENNLLMREIIISAMIVIINGQSCWLLLRRLVSSYRRIATVTAAALLAYIVVSAIRISALLLYPPQTNDFFRSGLADSISMIFYLSLSIIITVSFVLLVSRRLLEEVQTEKDKYNSAFHSSPYAILLTKLSDGIIFEVNEGFERISGYQSKEVIGKTTLEMGLWAQEEDRLAVTNEISRGNEVREYEFQFRVKSGDIVIGLLSAKKIMVYGEVCLLTSVSDITEMNRIRETLHDMATHDTLTGLPNRKLLYDRAEIAIANAKRDHEKIAVISLDVDFLKSINDRWGHGAGDMVLITLSNRLSNLLRKGDTVARFGGDEFLVLITKVTQSTDIGIITQKIMECLSEPIDIGETIVNVTVSIGIALYPDDGSDINALMKKSDDAMYFVKGNGRNNFKLYAKE